MADGGGFLLVPVHSNPPWMNLIRIEYDGHVSTVLQDHCGSSMGIQGVHPHTATLSAACRLHFDPST
jgi:hypothetical protein